MKRLMISMLVMFIFTATLFAGIAIADPPKIINKTPPTPLPKKSRADLIMRSLTLNPPVPRAQKDMVQIKVTIENAGTATPSAVCSWAMAIYNVDTHPTYGHVLIPQYALNVPRLAPHTTVEISRTITIPYSGRYRFIGFFDTTTLQAGEENESNNHYESFFNVVEPPQSADLVLDNLSPTNDGRIKIKMHNQGARIPDPDFNTSYVRVTVNDSIEKNIHLKDIDPTGLLKPGEIVPGINRKYLTYVWPKTGSDGISLEPGHTYKVKVVLDYNVRISDKNRANNTKTVTWHMTP
jgi:hypothetical protein